MAESTTNQRRHSALIIQPGALGDTLLTLALADYLRRAQRCRVVDLMAHGQYSDFLPGRSDINRVISFDGAGLQRLFVKPGDYQPNPDEIALYSHYSIIVTFLADEKGFVVKNLSRAAKECRVISLPIQPKTGGRTHVTQFILEQTNKQFGGKSSDDPTRALRIYILASGTDRIAGRAILESAGLTTSDRAAAITIIHPGSGGADKCWPLEYFTALARQLRPSRQIAFMLGPVELERWPQSTIDALKQEFPVLAGHSVAQALGAMGAAQSFIGNDSGIGHLAGMMGMKTILLYGPTDPAVWKPLGPRVRTLGGNGEWPALDEGVENSN